MPKIEYRVRPVTRWIVTRFEESDGGRQGGSRQIGGEHDNEEMAFQIATALCAKEHKDAGTPEDDPDFQYPVRGINVACVPNNVATVTFPDGSTQTFPPTSIFPVAGGHPAMMRAGLMPRPRSPLDDSEVAG